MKHHFYAYLSRLKYIKRWNLMRNTREESVQEHCHEVCMVAHALCLIRRRVLGLPADDREVLLAALYHEAAESITGDLPTPVKYFNGDIRQSYRAMEQFAEDRLVDMLPEEFRDDVAPYVRGEVEEETRRIVKAADKLCAYIKCVEEKRCGNREFDRAALATRRALAAMNMPEVDYFLEHFMPGFEMTLDELN